MVGLNGFQKRDKSLAPDGQLHKYIALIYTNYIKIMITLNAKSASQICSSPRILATPRLSYSSLNKTDIQWVQHKPDTRGECTSKEHVSIRVGHSTLHVFQCVAQCCRILLTRYLLSSILQKV
jgi:hypothetical protein